jgi:tRNA nucleotidyltransferase (CCA-adding enzyme)
MLIDLSLDFKNRDVVNRIAAAVKMEFGRALIVGGWVRDHLMHKHHASPDIDIEVYGLTMDQLYVVMDRLELRYDAVGAAFGILKLKDYDIDVSLPRRENRVGVKHTDFECTFDLDIKPEEAAARRDFTINSMYWDPMSKQLGDPFNGIADLGDGILRMTNAEKFGEDPLRVLRAMQFIGRFGFRADSELIEQSKQLMPQFESLSKERVYEEWKKLILKGIYFEDALHFLWQSDWITCFPELWGLVNLEQEPEWHPEGDAFTHTCHCMNAFGRLHIMGPNYGTVAQDFDKLVVGFGVLLHDVGKPTTTETGEDGKIRSLRHDKVGVPVAEAFMRRITDWEELIQAVLPMVGEHMFTCNFNKQQMTRRGIRRLARRCYSIDLLCYVIQCDKEGRPPMIPDLSDVGDLRAKAQEYDVYASPPVPIMMGRHLIEMGLEPGPQFGYILNQCQVAEDDGVITDVETGKHFVERLLADLDSVSDPRGPAE